MFNKQELIKSELEAKIAEMGLEIINCYDLDAVKTILLKNMPRLSFSSWLVFKIDKKDNDTFCLQYLFGCYDAKNLDLDLKKESGWEILFKGKRRTFVL